MKNEQQNEGIEILACVAIASSVAPDTVRDMTTSRNRLDECDDIQVSDAVMFVPHHTWTSGASTWIDGQLAVRGATQRIELDIGCFGDDDGCCLQMEHREVAAEVWAQGSVFAAILYEHAPRALIIPEQTLSLENVTEALRRFHP
jgi:hypothetical protein